MARPHGSRGQEGHRTDHHRSAAVATALALCCAALAGCGGGSAGDGGYVAVGVRAPEGPADLTPPKDKVIMVPLDGDGHGGKKEGGKKGRTAGARPPASTSSASSNGPGADSGSGGSDASGADPGDHAGASAPGSPGTPSAPSEPGRPSPPADPGTPAPPASPASLTVSAPEREPAEHRWCENVTVTFRNTGGKPATSGTVTFGTHIIGLLGIDWGTIDTDKPLPAPVAPGAGKEHTWEICVEAWRVPLGMHVETQDVAVEWK